MEKIDGPKHFDPPPPLRDGRHFHAQPLKGWKLVMPPFRMAKTCLNVLVEPY